MEECVETGDPDTDTIYHWLIEGAPAGIEVPITDEGNIFPPESVADSTDGQAELPDPLAHANYSSVDGDELLYLRSLGSSTPASSSPLKTSLNSNNGLEANHIYQS